MREISFKSAHYCIMQNDPIYSVNGINEDTYTMKVAGYAAESQDVKISSDKIMLATTGTGNTLYAFAEVDTDQYVMLDFENSHDAVICDYVDLLYNPEEPEPEQNTSDELPGEEVGEDDEIVDPREVEYTCVPHEPVMVLSKDVVCKVLGGAIALLVILFVWHVLVKK